MSSSFASGTKSLMSGERLSVRLPRRMVAICVSDPIGFDLPRRTLSTPAMNVVATAPRPGVRMPSLPVAGATPERDSFKRRFLLCSSTPNGALGVFGQCCGPLDRKLERLRGGAVTGLVIDVCNALNHGDPGADRDDENDGLEYQPVQRQTEKRLRGRKKRDALGALDHPHLRIETERLGPRASIGGHERADAAGHAHEHHEGAAVCRTQRIECRQAYEDRSVSKSIERRIEKRSERRLLAGAAG